MQQDHFKHIFWFIVGTTTVALAYIFIITFVAIPKENIRFADTAQGFLLGSVLGAGLAYLVGGNPLNSKLIPPPGTTNLELTTTKTEVAPLQADTSAVEIEGFKQKHTS